MACSETRWLPDDVAGVDLNGPGAPQVVVVREGVAGGEDASRGFTLEAAAALGYMCRHGKHISGLFPSRSARL